MITQVRAHNFKSWKDTGNLKLAPLTGFFGTNSSGKTSILQLLLMLKQTMESPDRKRVLHTGDERTYVDLGTFNDLVHDHKKRATLQLSLAAKLPEVLTINDPISDQVLFKVESLAFDTKISVEPDRAVVKSFDYSFGQQRFGMNRKPDRQNSSDPAYDLVAKGYRPTRVPGRAWPLRAPVKCYGFPDEALGYYQNMGFLPDLVLAFEKVFSRVFYLGPLREYPKRRYVWAGERPTDVGPRGEHAIAALLAARAEKLTFRRLVRKRRRATPIEERIAEWLQTMGLIYSFSLKSIAKNRQDYEVCVRKTATSPEVLITDVGFGVSQILPVLVLCYYAPEGSTVILEQPEIHLHPSVQADLADVLIEVVTQRNLQVIVESHSEHLVRRLQRRIAEEGIASEQTSLYFFQMEETASATTELDVDEYGNIRNWPPGFFGDEMGEVSAMTIAAMKRQGAPIE